MQLLELPDSLPVSAVEPALRRALASAAEDVVLQLRVPERLAGCEALRAERLRALAPKTANVELRCYRSNRSTASFASARAEAASGAVLSIE
jgi:hypothetical protein